MTNPLGAPRWRGATGRLEVWYATFTDRRSGLGAWIHHETVAPDDGREAYAHGWAALFPVAGGPTLERFGPEPARPRSGGAWTAAGGAEVADGVLRGATETMAWDLEFTDHSPPLYTFPKQVWERELLPAAQVVPWPDAVFRGTFSLGDAHLQVEGDGAVARIYGHGSAKQWGWLHAGLGDGGVLEIVSATARRAGLRALPPLALVQLRLPGEPDWPRNSLLSAVRFRTKLRADGFTVRGSAKGMRLEVTVWLPPDNRVALGYTDPDGSTATCTNSERASATITLTRKGGSTRRWHVDGTAHAEVGTRP